MLPVMLRDTSMRDSIVQEYRRSRVLLLNPNRLNALRAPSMLDPALQHVNIYIYIYYVYIYIYIYIYILYTYIYIYICYHSLHVHMCILCVHRYMLVCTHTVIIAQDLRYNMRNMLGELMMAGHDFASDRTTAVSGSGELHLDFDIMYKTEVKGLDKYDKVGKLMVIIANHLSYNRPRRGLAAVVPGRQRCGVRKGHVRARGVLWPPTMIYYTILYY